MNLQLFGILLGPAIGLAGVYCSYKAATGPRERRFVVWASIALAAVILAFLAGLLLLPQAKGWLWIAYPLTLAVGIRCLNRKQNAIRGREQADL